MNFLRCLPLLVLAPCATLISVRPQAVALAQVAPEPFKVEVDQFETEPVNPFNAEQGADTCMTVATRSRGDKSENVRWFYNRRLIATRDGQSRVLWNGKSDGFDSRIFVGGASTMSTGYRNENILFSLRDVPVAEGEIAFEWDALAKPSQEEVAWGDDKFVSLAELDQAAKQGGVHLSRKLVLRRDGDKILKPEFAAKPPLRVIDIEMRSLDKPDENGNDTSVVMLMAYEGDEAEPEITAPEGLELRDADKPRHDDENERIPRSYYDTAIREAQTQNYRLEASLKKADLKNVRFLSVEANISDGKSWPARLKAGLDLLHARK